MKRTRKEQRAIRRAIGPQAANALLDMDARALDIDRFLLLSHSFRRRLWWLLTGRFQMVGRLTVEEHTRRVALGDHLHVFLDGVDVTRRCREADDCDGFVVLYVHRNGRPFLGKDRKPVLETLRGQVEIVPGEPL